MGPIEDRTIAGKKSSKTKNEIEERTIEDRKINKKLFQIYQKQEWWEVSAKGNAGHWDVKKW